MKVARHSLNGTCEALLATFDEASRVDKSSESQERLFGCLAVVSGIAGVVGLGLQPVLGLGLLALVIPLIVLYRMSASQDLDNRRLDMVRRFLRVVRADVAPTATLRVDVDFRDYPRKEFQTAPDAYSMPWLTVRGRLADDSSFRMDVTCDVKRKTRRKRKYNKVKERLQEHLVLRLTPSPRRYPALEGFAPGDPPNGLWQRQLQVANGTVEARLASAVAQRVTARSVLLDTTGAALLTGDRLLASMVWMYRGLKSLKAQAMGTPG